MVRVARAITAAITRHDTARGALFVAGGTVVAQAINAGVTPLLTRLYGPETLGVLGTVLAYTGILVPVAALCLPLALIVSDDVQERRDVSKLALMTGLTIALVAVVLAPALLAQVEAQGVPWPIILLNVFLMVAFGAAAQLLHQFLLLSRHHRLLGRLLILQALFFAAAQVGVGLIDPSAAPLVAVSGLYFLVFLLPAFSVAGIRRSLGIGSPGKSWRATLRKRREFPIYRAPQVFISAIGVHLPALLLAWYADLVWVGLFVVVHRVLAVPVTLVAKSVGDVIYPRCVEYIRQELPVFRLLSRWTVLCTGLALLGAAIILIFGKPAFTILLGKGWEQAGDIAAVMAVWMVGALMSRPVVGSIPALGLSRHYLASDAIAVISRSSVLILMLTGGAGVLPSLLVWACISLLGNAYITIVGLSRANRLTTLHSSGKSEDWSSP